ncbi:hypothetical protein ACKI2N_013035 [Cupriavidus sp. 30B13]|uniref:hypothetical protein n=1 Tax=Cupriavidus sp. 30B13 TaxID=3384241 RepID=UPI003B91183B
MRWVLVLFLACELAAFALLAREAAWSLGRSPEGRDPAQWLPWLLLAAACVWLLSHWPALWRVAGCTYAGLAPGRDGAGRPAIQVRGHDGANALARVVSCWELGSLALVVALEPASGRPPRMLIIGPGVAAPDSLRALRRALGVARREQAAAREAA